MSIKEAFFEACDDAKAPEGSYVSLYRKSQYYGGPEEGGWYGTDCTILAYKYYPTEEAAAAALEQVEKLAQEKTQEAKMVYGEQCLREMDWLESRGLDSDYLREPDGPDEFYVLIESTPGSNCSIGPRRYE